MYRCVDRWPAKAWGVVAVGLVALGSGCGDRIPFVGDPPSREASATACQACSGSGDCVYCAVPSSKCSACEGSGRQFRSASYDERTGDAGMSTGACGACSGAGVIRCGHCNGSGVCRRCSGRGTERP